MFFPIKLTGNKIPFYIICGTGGTVFKFVDFVKLLDPEQPVYGLQQPSDSSCLEDFPTTTEGIARIYIEEILKQNPNGPYALSGHCFGGKIAFEMAVQLKKMGKEVSMLSMFDAYTKEEKEIIPGSFKNQYHIIDMIKNAFKIISLKIMFELFLLLKYPRQALIYKIEKIKSKMGIIEPEDKEMESFNEVAKVFEAASRSYQVKYYEGEILVFYAKEKYRFTDWTKGIRFKRINISIGKKNAWRKHAKSVKIYEVEGEHSTIFDPVNAKEFSQILQKHLDEMVSN